MWSSLLACSIKQYVMIMCVKQCHREMAFPTNVVFLGLPDYSSVDRYIARGTSYNATQNLPVSPSLLMEHSDEISWLW